jgi:hypothetical protein
MLKHYYFCAPRDGAETISGIMVYMRLLEGHTWRRLSRRFVSVHNSSFKSSFSLTIQISEHIERLVQLLKGDESVETVDESDVMRVGGQEEEDDDDEDNRIEEV